MTSVHHLLRASYLFSVLVFCLAEWMCRERRTDAIRCDDKLLLKSFKLMGLHKEYNQFQKLTEPPMDSIGGRYRIAIVFRNIMQNMTLYIRKVIYDDDFQSNHWTFNYGGGGYGMSPYQS